MERKYIMQSLAHIPLDSLHVLLELYSSPGTFSFISSWSMVAAHFESPASFSLPLHDAVSPGDFLEGVS